MDGHTERGHQLVRQLRRYIADAVVNEPPEDAVRSRPRRVGRLAQSTACMALLDLNDRCIRRFAPAGPAIVSADRWPWIGDLERRTADIRRELLRFLERSDLPHVTAMAGIDPDSAQIADAMPVLDGGWHTLPLFVGARWVPGAVDGFPATTAALRPAREKANVWFSELRPHSHIAAHSDPNCGALRLHLPLIVPGGDGDCRIRVGDEVIRWEEGRALVFDLAADHEVWNDSDSSRFVLTAELPLPLPRPLSWLNAITQCAYRWHPSFRQIGRRAEVLGLRPPAIMADVA